MDFNMIEIVNQSSDSSDASLLFDSSSTSSYSSSCSEEDLEYPNTTRIGDFLEVVDRYTERQFKEHFRLSRFIALNLIEKYNNFKRQILANSRGREELASEKEICITLWFLANTETYRQISDRFDVTKSSVFRVLHRVIVWMVTESNNYIKWPTSGEMKISQVKFAMTKNFPRVIGAIDGTLVRINTPSNNKEAYYNRKKYYSIAMQSIVDADRKFIDIHCGEPGAMHDARLFRKSKFFQKITEQPDLIIAGGVLNN